MINWFKSKKRLQKELDRCKFLLEYEQNKSDKEKIEGVGNLSKAIYLHLWGRAPLEISRTKVAKRYEDRQNSIANQVLHLLSTHEKNKLALDDYLNAAKPVFERKHLIEMLEKDNIQFD